MPNHTTGSSYTPDWGDTTLLTLPMPSQRGHTLPIFRPTPWIVLDDAQQIIEVDPDQVWFWTERWQEDFNEAEEDLREGRYKDFNTIDELLDDLDSDDD